MRSCILLVLLALVTVVCPAALAAGSARNPLVRVVTVSQAGLARTGPGLLDQTMERLERYRGHLYNWYDTRTLQPMPPLYVSSVDSGNLAGALVTMRAGLLELKEKPLITTELWEGLRDTLEMITAPYAESLRTMLQAPPTSLAALTLVSLTTTRSPGSSKPGRSRKR